MNSERTKIARLAPALSALLPEAGEWNIPDPVRADVPPYVSYEILVEAENDESVATGNE